MKIFQLPNPILRQKVEPVICLTPKIYLVINEMVKTLIDQKNPPGVGLAAPQVGVPLQIFIIMPSPPLPHRKHPKNKSAIEIFLNPKTIATSGAYQAKKGEENLEGCLSLHGYYGLVKRADKITLNFSPLSLSDLKSSKFLNKLPPPIGKTFTGFPAVIVQHEMDHLEGKLFIDRIFSQKGTIYKVAKDDKGKEILDEVKL